MWSAQWEEGAAAEWPAPIKPRCQQCGKCAWVIPDVQHPPPCVYWLNPFPQRQQKARCVPRSMAQRGTWPCPDDAISAQARLIKCETQQQQQLALGTSVGSGGRRKEPPHAAVIEFFQSSNKCLWQHRIFHFLAISIKTAGAASPAPGQAARQATHPSGQSINHPQFLCHFATLRPS